MAKFISKSANIYNNNLVMSSMYQNMSSWMPVMKSWQFPQQSLPLLMFKLQNNIFQIIIIIILIMHSLADAWLTFVNFLEKVFQLLLGHCLPLKYFFRGQYVCAYKWEWRSDLSGKDNSLITFLTNII